jgi:ribose 1,5-bisphosphokinase
LLKDPKLPLRESPAISHVSPGAIGPGRLILVVGPSGAGKDTLIRLAQADCGEDSNIIFPRRIVTREATVFEANEQVSREAFGQARGSGKFAVDWEAHGHCYALPRTIDDDIRANRTVVANVSRTVIDAMRRGYANLTVVRITAPPEILAERLAARRRGSDGEIAQRLGREEDSATAAPDMTITNIGSAESHARELVRIIRAE